MINGVFRFKDDKAVIILDSLDFMFYEKQIEKAIELWDAGVPWREIVERVRPPNSKDFREYSLREAEVLMLFVHLGLEGRLKKRPGAIYRGYRGQSEAR